MATRRNDPDGVNINDIDKVHECAHIFHDGNNCMNVAAPHELYCRWHNTAANREERQLRYSEKRRNKQSILDLVIPTIEDPESLQIAIHEVMDAIVDGRLTDRRAGHLLYGLQLSLANVKNRLHFPRLRYGVMSLMKDLEDEVEERRQRKIEREKLRGMKKPPQSATIESVKQSLTND